MDFNLPPELGRLPARARPLHRSGDQAARAAGRQHPLLRPSPRARPHRLGRGGLPREEWEGAAARGAPARRQGRTLPLRAAEGDAAARSGGTNLAMAVIREHLAAKGLGLHNDLQNEHSIVGNSVGALLMWHYGTDAQKKEWMDGSRRGQARLRVRHHRAQARLRRHAHGNRGAPRGRSLDHRRREDVEHRRPQGEPRHDLGAHVGQGGRRHGITAFLVPTNVAGLQDRGISLDVQHADRPCARDAEGRARARQRRVRRGRARAAGRAALLQREPHPAGGVVARRGAVLRQRGGGLRQRARAVRQEAGVATRRSSSRWSSCRRSARCCAP